MQVCDYAQSSFTFRIDMRKKKPITVSQPPPFSVNNAFFTVEASVAASGSQRPARPPSISLSSACKSEQVNVTGGVWHQPNADMCMVVSDGHFLVMKSWDRNNKGVKLHPATLGEQPERQIARSIDAFDSLKINLVMIKGRILETPDQIVATAMAGHRLVGQTDYTAPDGSAVQMEYPIKVLNISDVDHFYQTDTGPVLWPDFGTGWGENAIAGFRRAVHRP